MKYNLDENGKVGISLVPSSQNGAALHKGSGVDCLGFREALIIMSMGTMAGGSTDAFKVQESDVDVDGNYADVPNATFTATQASGHASKVFVGRVDLTPRKRWLRVVATDAGGAVLESANIALFDASKKPTTQQQTVAFSV